MQYQVFVQSHPERKFVASVVGMPNAIAEGETEEEAVAKVKAALESQLASGKFVTIEVNTESLTQRADPWIEHVGIFADDLTFDDFQAEVAAYRQQVDDRAVEE